MAVVLVSVEIILPLEMDMSLPLPRSPVNPSDLLKYLDDCGFQTTTKEHAPLFTVEDSQNLRGEIDGGHTKNLFLKDKKGNYFLLTAEEDSVVNLKTLHKLLGGSSKFSFGKPEALNAYLGVVPGAVSALGVINDRENNVTFAIDQRLMRHEKINCHPLTNDATTTIMRGDLVEFAKNCGHDPIIVDLDQDV